MRHRRGRLGHLQHLDDGRLSSPPGAGAAVAKHGNRAVSSRSGSADVLEALGVRTNVSADLAAECVDVAGVGFLFAPAHHPAFARVGQVRRELGTRTVFNLLGPLSNPAGAKRQLLGVYSTGLVKPLAEALKALGSEEAMVVSSRKTASMNSRSPRRPWSPDCAAGASRSPR